MIGTRPLASAAGGVLLAAGLAGGGGPGPWTALAAEELVVDRAAAALVALDGLSAELRASLAAGREGARRVLEGADGAGERLLDAAATLEAASTEAVAAQNAIDALSAAWRGARPTLPSVPTTSELRAIAEDLRVASPAADDAARISHGSQQLLAQVDSALATLLDGDHGAARRAAEAARASHDVLTASATTSDVLPVWLAATDAMITAVTSLIDATAAGDREDATAAADDFAALGGDAATADRALRIAIAEAADAAVAGPLARIDAAIGSVEEARAAISREGAAP